MATPQFDDLCERFAKDHASWFGDLRRKRTDYLALLKCPELRRPFPTTKQVEAVNGQLEILRRNCGGYFYS